MPHIRPVAWSKWLAHRLLIAASILGPWTFVASAGQARAAPPAALALTPALLSPPLIEGREEAIQCLTTAIVYEAAAEPLEGQQAVAQVIMNRTRNRIYPDKVCGVVYQGSTRRTGCQFTFTCDGSLRRHMPSSRFAAARLVAEAAYDGTLPDRVGTALFYHAHYVLPRWAPQLSRVGRIGAHIFYRQPVGRITPSREGERRFASNDPPSPAPPFAPWGLSVAADLRR